MKLLVVSHVIHYQWQDKLYAWGAYAREIDIWADLFSQVVIAAPCRKQIPEPDKIAFCRSNITIAPQHETRSTTIWGKIYQLFTVPLLLCSLSKAMRQADAIHVRCPGNLGLLGAILAPFFSKYRIAKYAGQWNGYGGEPWNVRLQRAVLRSRWWGAPVVVYSAWSNQPRHIIPFFTSVMTKDQIKHAGKIAETKTISIPLRVLFSGRLVSSKRVDALLEAVNIAVKEEGHLEVVIVGDGSQSGYLHNMTSRLGLKGIVNFVGALSFEETLKWYEWAHCLILPSIHSEGWPKVIAEAMCYGVLCIAVAHGQIPNMLEGKGILLKDGSPQEIADALARVMRQPEAFSPLIKRAFLWAQQYSLEGLQKALQKTMESWWGISLG